MVRGSEDSYHGWKEKGTEEITAVDSSEGVEQSQKVSIISGSMKEISLQKTVSSPWTRMLLKPIVWAQSVKDERSRELWEANEVGTKVKENKGSTKGRIEIPPREARSIDNILSYRRILHGQN